jgi:hypothetical protein
MSKMAQNRFLYIRRYLFLLAGAPLGGQNAPKQISAYSSISAFARWSALGWPKFSRTDVCIFFDICLYSLERPRVAKMLQNRCLHIRRYLFLLVGAPSGGQDAPKQISAYSSISVFNRWSVLGWPKCSKTDFCIFVDICFCSLERARDVQNCPKQISVYSSISVFARWSALRQPKRSKTDFCIFVNICFYPGSKGCSFKPTRTHQ